MCNYIPSIGKRMLYEAATAAAAAFCATNIAVTENYFAHISMFVFIQSCSTFQINIIIIHPANTIQSNKEYML